MTEPQAGSAVTDLQTKATPDKGGYRASGSKVFVTHSGYAQIVLAYVRFGPGVGGIGSVLIETNGKGVKRGKASAFMSGDAWTALHFDEAFLPEHDVLLQERR